MKNIWGSSTPSQCFESYCYGTSADEAVQKFNNERLIADISLRSYQLKFGIQAFDIKFGEPCRFLAALAELTQPKLVVDIGTSCGGSSRAFLDYSPSWASVVTYDILSWKDLPSTYLKESDFNSGRLVQHLVDLSDDAVFKTHSKILADADIIYLDAPKDGSFEYSFMDKLSKLDMEHKQRWLVMDDIRFMNMAALWFDIASPKFDATSLGHWSGTGLVDISDGLLLKKQG